MNKKTMNNPKSDISIDSLKFAALWMYFLNLLWFSEYKEYWM
jgi:hypothetical protein